MQAIRTHFAGPTNTRGARVVARASAGRVSLAWDYELNTDENHRRAAMAYAEKFNWRGQWVAGELMDCSVVFVCAGLNVPSTPGFTA